MRQPEINPQLDERIQEIIVEASMLSEVDPDQQTILLVEGATDTHFITGLSKQQSIEVRLKDECIVPVSQTKTVKHCKLAIIGILYGLYFQLIDYPNWKVFGMIDKDFDDDDDDCKKTIKDQLFIMDTHDIETLMLWSTKENRTELLQKIEGCETIKDADVNNALFMAYQLGTIRKLLHNKKISDKSSNKSDQKQILYEDEQEDYLNDLPDNISGYSYLYDCDPDVSSNRSGKKRISYDKDNSSSKLSSKKQKAFSPINNIEVYPKIFPSSDLRISLNGLISYLYKNKNTRESIFKQLSRDQSIKNYLVKEKEEDIKWKSGIGSFKVDKTKELWNVANGHEILSILRYLNEKVNEKYEPQHELDRAFEIALIDAYNNTDNFKDTEICKRMVAAGIVKA